MYLFTISQYSVLSLTCLMTGSGSEYNSLPIVHLNNALLFGGNCKCIIINKSISITQNNCKCS